MAALRALGKRLFVVSGGLAQALQPLAAFLGLQPEQVLAVEVFHGRDGTYQGWDELSPLTRSGGKLEVLRELARGDRGGGVVLIGDGVTDLEAASSARRFVAFAGVARRASVLERAAVRCERADLAALLPLIVAEDELQRLALEPGFAALLHAAQAAS
jgi:phosphoserine phosphatase